MAFQRFGISKFPGGECPRTPLDLCCHKCALVRYRAGSAPGLEPGKFCWRDVSKVAASIFKREVTSSYFTWFQDSEKTLELKMFMFEWIVVYDESILILLGLAKARKTNPTPLVRPFSLTNPCFPLFKLKLIPKFSHRTFPHHLGGHCCD